MTAREHNTDDTENALRALARHKRGPIDDCITLKRERDGTWTLSIYGEAPTSGRTVLDAVAAMLERLPDDE